MIKCLMLDFDDTLYNFSEAIKKTFFHMIKQSGVDIYKARKCIYDLEEYNEKKFCKINILYAGDDSYNVTSEFIDSAFDYYKIFSGIIASYSNKIISSLEYNNYFLSQCRIINDCVETLMALKALGTPIVILSDGRTEDKIKVLKHFKIEWIFDYIITSDSTQSLKPSLKFFNKVKDLYSIDLKDCIYIGNHISDYIMSKKAHVKFYAFNADNSLSSCADKDDIIFINSIKDLITIENRGKNDYILR